MRQEVEVGLVCVVVRGRLIEVRDELSKAACIVLDTWSVLAVRGR